MAKESKNKAQASLFSRLKDLFIPAEYKTLKEESEKLKSFFETIPAEYCGWSRAGAQALSGGFCQMLGVEKIETLQDIQNAIDPSDAASLESLFERLREIGESFDITVRAVNTGKTLKVLGKNSATEDVEQRLSVIWAYDISNFVTAVSSSVESLRLTERREHELLATINSLPFPLWVRNKNLDIIWCNKSYSNIVDESNASIVADQKELALSDKNKTPLSLRSLAKSALVKNDICSAAGKTVIDGKRRLLDIKEIPVKGEDLIVGVGIDITKEEELETSHKRLTSSYYNAMEQLSTAIAMYDADTKLEFYNSAYEQMTGMSASWLNTHPRIIDVIDKLRELRKIPEQVDYKQYKQQWLNRFTSLIEPLEEIIYLPDSTVIRMIIVPRPQGGLMVTREDVTSQMKLETSYNTLMEVQKETMNNLSEGLAVFGEDGKLKLYNYSFSKLWNIMPEVLANSPHISRILEALDNSLSSDKNVASIKQTIMKNALDRDPRTGRILKADGKIIEYSVEPLPDGNILNTYFDITDSVKVEEALQAKNMALQAAERLKTNFIANVSYQLRTPLNSIMGFAEMLKQQYIGQLNDKQVDYMENILTASDKLKGLINDILDLASIEAGQLELIYSKVNAKKLVNEIVDLTKAWGRKHDVEIESDCEDQDLEFAGDEGRMKQALINLISNAFNFSNKGGKVVISSYKEGEFVVIKVKDSGVGIAKENLDRIFTPFDQIKTGKTTQKSGAGLGLTLVKNIVELHGGKITVESEENLGTSMFIKVPCDKKPS